MFLVGPWHADNSSIALWISCNFCIGMVGFYNGKDTHTDMRKLPSLRYPGQRRVSLPGRPHHQENTLPLSPVGALGSGANILKYKQTHYVNRALTGLEKWSKANHPLASGSRRPRGVLTGVLTATPVGGAAGRSDMRMRYCRAAASPAHARVSLLGSHARQQQCGDDGNDCWNANQAEKGNFSSNKNKGKRRQKEMWIEWWAGKEVNQERKSHRVGLPAGPHPALSQPRSLPRDKTFQWVVSSVSLFSPAQALGTNRFK